MAIPVQPAHGPQRRRPRWRALAGAGVVAVALAFVVRPQVARYVQTHHALEADSFDTEQLEELLSLGGPEEPVLQRLWDTGRIPHRRTVLQHLLQHRDRHPTLARTLILDAATDPDGSLRELALGSLPPGESTEAVAIIQPQLTDADPDLRLQALQTLRRAGHVGWTPRILPLLQEPDATLAVAADALLRRWSGIDSGLRFADLEADPILTAPSRLTESQRADLAAAHQQRVLWWNQPGVPHPPAPHGWTDERPRTVRRMPSSSDWSLPDLDGHQRSLAEFRGRLVLLNFWATWCPPCLRELPTLIELQSEFGTNHLVILGISLDGLAPVSHDPTAPAERAASPEAHARSIRTVALRHRVNYPVLLDPAQRVGRVFDGQELPTQVLIDRQGRLVRRFLGPRSLETWRALLEDADHAGLQGTSDLPIR